MLIFLLSSSLLLLEYNQSDFSWRLVVGSLQVWWWADQQMRTCERYTCGWTQNFTQQSANVAEVSLDTLQLSYCKLSITRQEIENYLVTKVGQDRATKNVIGPEA